MNMSKIFLIIIILVLIGAAGFLIYKSESPSQTGGGFDPLNASYNIEGTSFSLINGKAEKEIAPGSASKIEVMVFGQPAENSITGGEKKDAALILTYSAGGSGTFYYIAADLQDSKVGTNAILLGDRIAPQNISISNGVITVNYADRKTGEPMTVQPSVGITRNFSVHENVLVESTPETAKREQACLLSGGGIKTVLCCKSSDDFPNTCLIGACGCSSDNSKEVKSCDCGLDACFDGKSCQGTGEQNVTFCTQKQRNADVCPMIYDPVCAKVNVQCVKAPCNPVYENFSNSCVACINEVVESYIKGECTSGKQF